MGIATSIQTTEVHMFSLLILEREALHMLKAAEGLY
jgi:hypothetical protein